MKQVIHYVGDTNEGQAQFSIDGSRYNPNLLTKENYSYVQRVCRDIDYDINTVSGHHIVQIVGYNGKRGGEIQTTIHVDISVK